MQFTITVAAPIMLLLFPMNERIIVRMMDDSYPSLLPLEYQEAPDLLPSCYDINTDRAFETSPQKEFFTQVVESGRSSCSGYK
jgi:hypothetical protein